MQLAHPMYSTTRIVRKCMTGKPKTTAQRKHEEFVNKMTNGRKSNDKIKNQEFRKNYKETMKVDRSDYVSNGMVGDSTSCSKKDIMTRMFKETPEVQKQIMEKAARIAPLFSKGPLQYITDGTDKTDVGRKK